MESAIKNEEACVELVRYGTETIISSIKLSHVKTRFRVSNNLTRFGLVCKKKRQGCAMQQCSAARAAANTATQDFNT